MLVLTVLLGSCASSPPPPSPARIGSDVTGQANYEKFCLRCHGPDGRANTPEGIEKGAANLQDRLGSLTDEQIVRQVLHGSHPMPAFDSKMLTDQIWHIVAYLRELDAAY